MDFTIASYNTHLFGGTLPGLRESYKDSERRDRICDYFLENPSRTDILCLCEVWSDKWKRLMVKKLKNVFPSSAFYRTPIYSVGSGLLILSKFPITKFLFEDFNELSSFDWMSRKGVACMKIELEENIAFRLFFSHVQAEDKVKERFSNLSQIFKKVESFDEKNLPSIILGDMNVQYSTFIKTEYENMKKVFHTHEDVFGDEFIPTASGGIISLTEKFKGSFCEMDPAFKLDHIFVEKKKWKVIETGVWEDITFETVENEEKITYDCSDHFPVFSTLKML